MIWSAATTQLSSAWSRVRYPDEKVWKRSPGASVVTWVLLIFFCSCHNEKPKDDFENDQYIETFGAASPIPLGNSGLTINVPSTHYIETRKGNDYVEFLLKSVDTTINKGQGIVWISLKAGETDESMIKDTVIVDRKYDSLHPDPNGHQIYVWTEHEANSVEQFNLATTMNSIHR